MTNYLHLKWHVSGITMFKIHVWEFLGGPLVRTWCCGPGFNPWSGN